MASGRSAVLGARPDSARAASWHARYACRAVLAARPPPRQRDDHARRDSAATPAQAAAAHSAELAAFFEQYFEDLLALNPLLATFIGDNRYNDQLPNDIGPEYRARQRELNERYLAACARVDANAL